MKLYSKLKGLELAIESFKTETQRKKVLENFTRKTTTIRLSGNGKTGKRRRRHLGIGETQLSRTRA